MELRDIEYFAVVAEYKSVRRAADALDLSPPALSKSLRRLEGSLQAKLVTRTSKGIELTPVGAALLTQVHRIRLTLSDVARETTDLTQGRSGHLRVAASPAVGEELPAAYAVLAIDAPDVTLRVSTMDNDESMPLLLKGELDLIFNYVDVLSVSPRQGLTHEHLYDERVVVCSAANHRLARLKRVPLDELAQERWVATNPTLLNVQWLHKVFQNYGLPAPRVAVEASSIHLRLQIIARSNLVGYVPVRVLSRVSKGLRLSELSVPELVWRRPVGVIYRSGGYISPAARRFIEILKMAAKELTTAKR